jgi:hypothetical protein
MLVNFRHFDAPYKTAAIANMNNKIANINYFLFLKLLSVIDFGISGYILCLNVDFVISCL